MQRVRQSKNSSVREGWCLLAHPQDRCHSSCRTEGPLSVAGSTESREGVNLDCVLKGRSLSAVRYADPHLQVHLRWEEGFRWRNQLCFNWDWSYNNRFVGVVWKKVWRLILVLYFHNDLTSNYRNFDLQGGYFLLCSWGLIQKQDGSHSWLTRCFVSVSNPPCLGCWGLPSVSP